MQIMEKARRFKNIYIIFPLISLQSEKQNLKVSYKGIRDESCRGRYKERVNSMEKVSR